MARTKFNNKKSLNKFFNNIYTLYSIAFIAFIQVLLLFLSQEFSGILLFIMVCILTYLFTHNMSIVLFIAILSTFLVGCLKKFFTLNNFEGLENKKTSIDKNSPENANNPNFSKKSGYQNNIKLNPGVVNTPNKEEILKQVGPENKIEQEYDKLTSVLKNNDIKSVSNDTKNLINDQKKLLEELKNMTPVVDEAMKSLQNIDLQGLNGMFDSMKTMASGLDKRNINGK
tara:strand:- start:825 stop:1508 length:684 start_codon:yes stop_codon:yes gene_type:complete